MAHWGTSAWGRGCVKTLGQFSIDEDVLRETGIQDFAKYAVDSKQQELERDLFLD